MAGTTFIFQDQIEKPIFFRTTIEAPSNIALVKYWGKEKIQIPKNPSLSFTLSECRTTTTLEFHPKKGNNSTFDFEVFFEGREASGFKPKIQTFFERIEKYVPFLKYFRLKINTSNSFPHSSGIASSASGMAALAAGLIELEKELSLAGETENYYLQKTSFLARLGSGSASRSITGPMMLWGKHREFPASSDEFAIGLNSEIHPVFKTYRDTILLIDRSEKKVSSSIGHGLMNNHPYAEKRFEQAGERVGRLREILKNGNQKDFIQLVESEALTLHAMMMSSSPYFLLMKPNTLNVIEKVWEFREKENVHLAFTLDAGANVHLLYPENEEQSIRRFIEKELRQFCENGKYIHDQIGSGIRVQRHP